MNFNTLRYVVAVAKERSFTKAAHSLYVSQPTLSQNIQALESKLGTALFDRKSYPIMPTYAGKLYIDFAQKVLLSESQINRKISNAISNPRVRIRIGISPSKSILIMPELLHTILEEFPDCIISLEDSKSENDLFTMLDNNEIDVMIGSPIHNSLKYKSQFIANELLILAVPKAYEFPGKSEAPMQKGFRRIRLGQLKDYPFIILPLSTFLGENLQMLCEREEFSPYYSIECSNVQTSYNLAKKGLGIALITELMATENSFDDELDYFALQSNIPQQKIAIITNSNGIMTHPVQRFVELFKERFLTKQVNEYK